jgi:hypothetical protein
VPLVTPIKATDVGLCATCPRSRPRGSARRFEQRSVMYHLQVRVEANVKVRRAADGDVAPAFRNAESFRRSLTLVTVTVTVTVT